MIPQPLPVEPLVPGPALPSGSVAESRSRWEVGGYLLTLVLLGVHTTAMWLGMGGWSDLTGEWPLIRADHGLHYVHGIASREFLRTTGFTAGYDPSYMAGFAMSIISGTSSTLQNGVMLLFGGTHPAQSYKWTVFGCSVLAPVLMGWAAFLFGGTPRAMAWTVLFYLIYFWTDFAKFYLGLGMVSYLLVVPLALVALATLVGYLEQGGWKRWVGAAVACSSVLFVHLTSPLVLGPAGLLAYGYCLLRSVRGREPLPWLRQGGFFALAVVILAVNAFWWLPGYWLRSTVGETELAFAHAESTLGRVAGIAWSESLIQPVLIAFGLMGLRIMAITRPVAAVGLLGLVAAGFAWGYLAGLSRALDGLQPGRHTYAMYSGLCLATGCGIGRLFTWVRQAHPGRFDRWLAAGFVLLGIRLFGPSVEYSVSNWLGGPVPYLSSRPLPSLLRLIVNLRKHVKPGERLLYEESGIALPGLDDIFAGRHFSPVLPSATGVEVLGGPYLHMPVTTNFTQFGEGKLFGEWNWGREQFLRYAQIYRPTAIACWTPKAKLFCTQNPDLIEILVADRDILVGRIRGFEGATSQGQAQVEATPNRLVVRDMVPDRDGLIVLRYHLTPCLVADPPIPIEPIYLAQDPVPFIGLRPAQTKSVTIRMVLPPVQGWWGNPALAPR